MTSSLTRTGAADTGSGRKRAVTLPAVPPRNDSTLRGDKQRHARTAGGVSTDAAPAAVDVKASLLWAAIGGLAFLVLIQGFEIWSGQRVSFLVKFAVAAVVAVAAGATTYLLRGRLVAPNESA